MEETTTLTKCRRSQMSQGMPGDWLKALMACVCTSRPSLTLLVLNLGLDVLDGVRGLNLEGDRLACRNDRSPRSII